VRCEHCSPRRLDPGAPGATAVRPPWPVLGRRRFVPCRGSHWPTFVLDGLDVSRCIVMPNAIHRDWRLAAQPTRTAAAQTPSAFQRGAVTESSGESMRVTVFGSTGRTGRLVLTEGLRRDWPSPAPTPWSQKGPVWPSHCCDSCSPKGTPIWRRWSRSSPPPINGGTSPEPLAEPHNLETHAGHARPPSRRPGATVAMRHTRPIQRWAGRGTAGK
jgi:hypothetical protein